MLVTIAAAADLLAVPEVAKRLGVSRRTVFRLLSKGALRKVRASEGRIGISAKDLADYIERGGWQSDSIKVESVGSSSSSRTASAFSGAYRKGAPARRRKV